MLTVNKKEGWVKGSHKELKRYFNWLYLKQQLRLPKGAFIYPGGGYSEPYKS